MSKALGKGIYDEVKFKDIQVFKDSLGKPYISLSNSTLKLLKKKKRKIIKIIKYLCQLVMTRILWLLL